MECGKSLSSNSNSTRLFKEWNQDSWSNSYIIKVDLEVSAEIADREGICAIESVAWNVIVLASFSSFIKDRHNEFV